jgi:hypothetical protein
MSKDFNTLKFLQNFAETMQRVDMHLGHHAARTCSMDMQYGHAAWTCSYGHAAWTCMQQGHHHGHIVLACSIDMQQVHEA